MLCYKHFETKEDWLKGRDEFPGIGASEAAAVVGVSNWMTTTELWEIKTGRKTPKNLDDSDIVQYGTKAEEHIRSLFMLKHEEYNLLFRPFDFLYQKKNPWLRCTLDGELVRDDGEHGILEVKTHLVRNKNDLSLWKDRIPDHYYCQILHQFLATGFEYCYLTAELIFQSGESSIRTYYYLRRDCAEDMQWLFEEEKKFWKSVIDGNSPSVKLIL